MSENKPNHICKSPLCTKGNNGAPMHYWACNDCDKRNSWKAVACDEECYVEYLNAIATARGTKATVKDRDQLSLFDEPAAIVEAVSSSESGTPFMGYSKKRKHY